MGELLAAEYPVGRRLEKKQVRRIKMPVFGSPFSGLANNRQLTDEELVRAIRFAVSAEYEATHNRYQRTALFAVPGQCC
jgi:hypothetical protein